MALGWIRKKIGKAAGWVEDSVSDAVGDFVGAVSDAIDGTTKDSEVVNEAYNEVTEKTDGSLAIDIATALQVQVGELVLLSAFIMAGGVQGIMAAVTEKTTALRLALIADLQPLLDAYKKEEDRLKGIVDSELVQTTLLTLRDLNSIALIISPLYRDQVENLYRTTRDISRSVFGESTTILSALNLYQLIAYDTARLRGEKPDAGQAKFISGAIKINRMVADQAKKYQRNPEAFWYDVQMQLINPEQEAAYYASLAGQEEVARLSSGLRSLEVGVSAFQGRYQLYRDQLDPFLSDSNLRWLDATSRSFERDYASPLRRLNKTIDEKLPDVEKAISDLETDTENLGDRLSDAEVATKDPSALDAKGQALQVARVGSILNHTLALPALTEEERLEAQGQRIASILEHLERR